MAQPFDSLRVLRSDAFHELDFEFGKVVCPEKFTPGKTVFRRPTKAADLYASRFFHPYLASSTRNTAVSGLASTPPSSAAPAMTAIMIASQMTRVCFRWAEGRT
jgi:hypothetical protein